MAINGYPVCLDKQRRIDELEEQVKGLQAKLRYQERKELDGPFGSSTPSSKLPVKPNAEQKEKKPKEPGRVTRAPAGRVMTKQAVDRTVEVGPTSGRCVRNAAVPWRKRDGLIAASWTLHPKDLKK